MIQVQSASTPLTLTKIKECIKNSLEPSRLKLFDVANLSEDALNEKLMDIAQRSEILNLSYKNISVINSLWHLKSISF